MTAAEPIGIPWQLQRADLAFILVRSGSKGAMERAWPATANYPVDHVRLQAHVARGHPYGVFARPGSRIFVVDCDDYARLAGLGAIDALPDSFTVASGSSTLRRPKVHLYLEIEGEPLIGRRVFYDAETGGEAVHLGELFAQHPRSAKGYVIGPGSRHATTGQPYTIAADEPIATVTRAAWMAFANAVRWEMEGPDRTEPAAPGTAAHSSSFGDMLGIAVGDIWPIPATAETSGEWRKFAHPIHGSRNGNNLAVHRDGHAFYCHRCRSSGDGLIALAVASGIILCSDARPGCLASKELMERVKDAARARGYAVDEAERQAHLAYLKSQQPMPYEAQDIRSIKAALEAKVRAAVRQAGAG